MTIVSHPATSLSPRERTSLDVAMTIIQAATSPDEVHSSQLAEKILRTVEASILGVWGVVENSQAVQEALLHYAETRHYDDWDTADAGSWIVEKVQRAMAQAWVAR